MNMSSELPQLSDPQLSTSEIPDEIRANLETYYGFTSRLRECRAAISALALSIQSLQLEGGEQDQSEETEELGRLRAEHQSLEESAKESGDELANTLCASGTDNGAVLPPHSSDFKRYSSAIRNEGGLWKKMIDLRGTLFRQLLQFKREGGEGVPSELLDTSVKVVHKDNRPLTTIIADTKSKLSRSLESIDALQDLLNGVERSFFDPQPNEIAVNTVSRAGNIGEPVPEETLPAPDPMPEATKPATQLVPVPTVTPLAPEPPPAPSLPNAEGLLALMNTMGEIGAISAQLSELQTQREHASTKLHELRQKISEHEARDAALDKREAAIEAKEAAYKARVSKFLDKLKAVEHLFPATKKQ